MLAFSTLLKDKERLARPSCQMRQNRHASTTLASFELLLCPDCVKLTPKQHVLFSLPSLLPETFTCIFMQNWDEVIGFGVSCLEQHVVLLCC